MAESSIDSVIRRDDRGSNRRATDPPRLHLDPLDLAFEFDQPPKPSPPADGSGSDGESYGEDDAQSLIEPAMSPAATRLTNPKTPAAEKMAAMDRINESYFDSVGGEQEDDSSGEETPKQAGTPTQPGTPKARHDDEDPVTQSSKLPETASTPPPQPGTTSRLPTPWKTGPKEITVTGPDSRPAVSGPSTTTRHQRSASGSTDALRRLSKALPSLSLPSLPNRFPVPNFFSSLTTNSQPDSKSPSVMASPKFQSSVSPGQAHSSNFSASAQHTPKPDHQNEDGAAMVRRQPSAASRRSLLLRRSTSDESLLYHSLSRMSSYGDDQRFTHVREQVNSRFKAIMDSFDTPSFKLPSMPSTLNLRSPLKKTEFSIEETHDDPSRTALARANKGPKDPLDIALENLTGDLVILGGYRGSVLRSAEPPHRQLWVPIKVGLNVRKVNLEVGLDPEDEERSEESIVPSGMLKHIGPVDISRRLFKRIRECENVRTGKLRLHDYGYDWRLSPHLLSKKLVNFLKRLPSNRGANPSGAFVIAHSLGGMITRHAVNTAPELFSGVVYAGAPQRCINILGPLRNGDAVLLNEKVLTAHVNFTLRTTFVFLPEDGFCFIDKTTGEEFRIDFYNPEEWVRHRLCPSVGGPELPALTSPNKRPGPLGSLLSLPDSLSLSRGRSTSDPSARLKPTISPPRNKLTKDRGLMPQMDASASTTAETQEQQQQQQQQQQSQQLSRHSSPPKRSTATTTAETENQARNLAYLTRTLAETKQFRAELAHNPAHQASNVYPPIAIIYGKEIPTVYAARVQGREAIACAGVYDDLAFASGDGVILAREAMPPPGYQIVRGGRVSTGRGHLCILGDMPAVGRAISSVLRGREKGIGKGPKVHVGLGVQR